MDALQISQLTHWVAGWLLILGGFVSGALLGLGFHRPDFVGGYGSFERRLLRLGHIALVALGMLNLLASAGPERCWSPTFGALLMLGSAAMPGVCFLAAWKRPFRHAFALPVTLLAGAALVQLATSLEQLSAH